MSSETLGAVAAALVKAQSAFPAITRDKTVTVKTKTGGEYKFAYAPLDQILGAVREPLAQNGLAITQLIDGDALVTMLLHDSGEYLEGRTRLADSPDIQAFGSAITYLRRYAVQALLGIAAEEDDDGNRAAGNSIRAKAKSDDGRPAGPSSSSGAAPNGPWRGEMDTGVAPVDGNLRATPDGADVFGFILKAEKRLQVLAVGPLATALAGVFVKGATATVEGTVEMIPWDKDGKKMPPFRRVIATRVSTADYVVPADKYSDDELDKLDF